MTEDFFATEIEKVLNDEQEKLIVQKEDFFVFRKVWLNHPKKDFLEGEAGLKGIITYRKVDDTKA